MSEMSKDEINVGLFDECKQLRDDRQRLIDHCAVMGIEWPDTGDLCDMQNQSWRSLPDHLTTEIEAAEEVCKNSVDHPDAELLAEENAAGCHNV